MLVSMQPRGLDRCHTYLSAADHERGLGAQGVEDAGQLNCDVAAANDEDALGLRFQFEKAIAVDGVLAACKCRCARVAARGDADVRCSVERAVDVQRVGCHELGPASNLVNLRLGNVGVVDAVQPHDVCVAALLRADQLQQ